MGFGWACARGEAPAAGVGAPNIPPPGYGAAEVEPKSPPPGAGAGVDPKSPPPGAAGAGAEPKTGAVAGAGVWAAGDPKENPPAVGAGAAAAGAPNPPKLPGVGVGAGAGDPKEKAMVGALSWSPQLSSDLGLTNLLRSSYRSILDVSEIAFWACNDGNVLLEH